MMKMDESITIKDHIAKHAILWLAMVLTAFVGVWIWVILQPEVSTVDFAVAFAASALMFGSCLYCILLYCQRLVFWAEMGQDFRFRTLWGQRCVPWREVGRVVLRDADRTCPYYGRILVTLTDATRLEIWALPPKAEAVYDLVRTKACAANWAGLPLGKPLILSIVALGVICLSLGLFCAFLIWREYFTHQPNPSLLGASLTIPLAAQVLGSIGGPVLGLVGIGFGSYHLLRRPVMFRPGVYRARETQPKGFWGTVKGLFAHHD